MPVWEILCFARVIRACIAVSLTRNAFAISADDNPQTSRRVRAICASWASAGWQQVNTSRSRSSGNTPAATSASSIGSGISNGSLRSDTAARRRSSSARRVATVVSQAPGRRGMPCSSQCTSALA